MAGPRPILQNGIASTQGIWDVRDTGTSGVSADHEVGTRAHLPDGRVFYYARNSGIALIAGQLLMSEVVDAQNEDMAVGTAQAGDTTVTITSGTTTAGANDFAAGYMCVVDDTGEGITYRIASHPSVAASTDVIFTLQDAIQVTFATTTTVALVKNQWQDPVVAAAGHVHNACGVSQVAVGAGTTNKQFFWVQTWGVSCAWQDAATAIGASLQSGATAGQVEVGDGAAQLVGTNLFTGTVAEYQPVFLTIAP